MHSSVRTTVRKTPNLLIAVGIFCCSSFAMTFGGCDSADPLEAIRAQHEAGDYDGSVEPLRELLEEDPDNAEANYRYGLALSATNRANLAIWSFRKAMEDPDWLVPAGVSLAYAALNAHDFNEVVNVATRVLEVEPDNQSALVMRANAYAHWKTDPEKALADADRVLELNPDALEAYEPKILALLSLDRLDEATAMLAEAGEKIRQSEDSDAKEAVLAWYCSTTAAFQLEGGHLEQARETWSTCLEEHPTDPEVVANAIGFYDGQGEPERGTDVLKAAVEAAPAQRQFRFTLALRLAASGATDEAEAVLIEPTQAKNPLVAAASWIDLGELRRSLGQYGGAAEAIETAIGLVKDGSTEAPLLFGYADALVLAGRLEDALDVAARLAVPAQRHLIRGRVAQEQRDPTRALREFGEAHRLWPDNPWSRYYSALAAEELGDFKLALEQYRYAVRIEPSATDARTRGADLLLALGQPAAAMQMLNTAEAETPADLDGKLMQLRLAAVLRQPNRVKDLLAKIDPIQAAKAVASAARSMERLADAASALELLDSFPGIDLAEPAFAEALRERVRLAHRVEGSAAGPDLAALVSAHPDSSAWLSIRGLDLELSGAPRDAVRAAYDRALELDPDNAYALAGLGRLASTSDPSKAQEWFDKAMAAAPSNPDFQLQAARALIAAGKDDLAAKRLDKLLLEHPFELEAAVERAKLDLARGVATEQTLERARRAASLGGGADAFDLLSLIHTQRNEPEPAARATERALQLRETAASKETASSQG